MRNGFLGSFATLATGAALAFGQGPAPGDPPSVAPAGAIVPAGMPIGALPTDDGPPDVDAGPLRTDPRTLPRSARGGAAQNVIPSTDEVRVSYRAWARGEYLLWWINNSPASPPLATTGPRDSFGILGVPGVVPTLGSREVDFGEFHGARLTAGLWFDQDAHIGVEANWMMLFENTLTSTVASDPTGSPVVARPVFDAVARVNGVQLVGFPNALTGSLGTSTSSELWGVEVNFLGSEYRGEHAWIDLIAGFRFLNFEEDLKVSSSATVMEGGAAAFLGQRVGPGIGIAVSDRFLARNQFFGGTIGLRSEFCYDRFFGQLQGKLSIGNNHQVVIIDGSSTMTSAAGTTTVPAGLLAVASNSRVNSRDEFTLIPEFHTKLGFYVNRNVNVFVGYTYMYWSDVVRPGPQVSTIINPSLVPTNLAFGANIGGPRAPAAIIQKSDFWAQGVNFGLELRY